MVMDEPFRGLKLGDETYLGVSDWDLVNGFRLGNSFVGRNCVDIPPLPPDPVPRNVAPSSSVVSGGDPNEDFDFSDVVLKYISDMLMEEDIEEKTCMFLESSAIQAAEKSFYDALGEKYPPYDDKYHGSSDESYALNCTTYDGSAAVTALTSCSSDFGEFKSQHKPTQSNSQSLSSSSTSPSYTMEGFVDSPVSTLWLPDIFSDKNSVMQFNRGVEEASKFLPNGGKLIVDLESHGFTFEEMKEETKNVVRKVEKKHVRERFHDGSRGKRNTHSEDVGLESGRCNKQSAVCSDSTVSSDMFDMVLLNCPQGENALREALQSGTSKKVQQNGQPKGSSGKSRGKKKGGKKDVIDLRTLLTLCAQAVSADDRRNANDLLKQIRQHSSPTGDGMQRMAHFFANGLEARLAGSGTQVYKDLITKPTSAADVLKAYHLFLAACPFRKLSNFFSNKTIMNVAEKATKLHIIDFGILYGFQWPCLIQRLSTRKGGPPKIRITGVDFPQPGFKPAERVEETGHRLAKYAEQFNVPFEFNAIAQKWDTIQMEDFKIDPDELLVVNCLYRFRNLLDETVVAESPRDVVMNLIRKMNPCILIEGIVNGAYSAPFFITRFREALFFFSSVFDVLEANIPRDIPERMLLEAWIFGREAMNVIACEGSERIERPETYKQWQVRNTRAGFTPLPLDREIVDMAKDRVKSFYHKDFVIDEDGQWLLQGWKGRILYALSTWKPAAS